MNLYFDTSALVKLFHYEQGTDIVSDLINNTENEIYVSELVKIEFFCALYRRFRNNEISEEKLEQAVDSFEEQLNNFDVEPLGHTIINEAEHLLKRFGKTCGLRTLDALHLATFSLTSNADWHFVSTDKTLCDVVIANGFKVINPINW